MRLRLGLGKDADDLVFTSPDGSMLYPNYVTEAFAREVERAGLKPVRFHALRHSHLSMLLRDGIPVHALHLRIVEEIALMSPCITEYFIPFRTGIDCHLERKVQPARSRSGSGICVRNSEVMLSNLVEHFASVGVELIVLDTADNGRVTPAR